MKLGVSKREKKAKSELSLIRFEGNIPAVLYGSKDENLFLTVNGPDFHAVLRKLPQGHLSTTVFDLTIDGKKTKAIVKEIQYHPTTYKILHLDLLRLHDDVPVMVNVPVDCSGVAECTGIKLGGFLRQVKRQLRVKCLPKHLPKEFLIDVRDLHVGQSKRVKDIDLPKDVSTLALMEDVLVIIAKR